MNLASLPFFYSGMDHHFPTFYLLLLLIALGPSSCHNKPLFDLKKHPAAYEKHVSQLKQRAKPFYNSGNDSLGILAEEILLTATQHKDTVNMIEGQILKANYDLRISNYAGAMKNALAALRLAEARKNIKRLSDIYGLMGNAYKENEYYKGALYAAQKALTAARQLKDTSAIIGAMLDYAMFMHSYSMKENDDSIARVSLQLYLQGLHLAETHPGNEAYETAFLDDISQYYKIKGDYNKGITYGKRGAALAHQQGRKRSLTYSLNWLGFMYYKQDKHQLGMIYIDSALHYAQALEWPFRVAEILESKYKCYQSSGEIQKALDNLVESHRIRDSLQMLKNVKQVSLLQVQYQTGKKEQRIAMLGQLNKKKTHKMKVILMMMGIFLLLAIFLSIQYRGIRRRNRLLKESYQKIEKQSDKLNLLMKELHHRVKNNLQIVSGLLSIQSNHLQDQDAMNAVKTGQQRIEAMSLIHRSLYQQENPHAIDMKGYVNQLLENLFFEFGINRTTSNLQVRIDLRELDVDIALPLGLIINEWMTNVFKYAFRTTNHPTLHLSLLEEEDQIILKIQDNGSGMTREAWDHPQDSFGVKLIKILTKQLDGDITMDNQEGTTLRLGIPIKHF